MDIPRSLRNETPATTAILLLLSLFVPPVPVGLKRGFFTTQFWINVLLWALFHFPAVIHAWYIVLVSVRNIPSGYEPVSEEQQIENSETVPSASDSMSPPPGPSSAAVASSSQPPLDGGNSSSGAPPPYEGNGRVVGDHKVQHHQEFP